MKEYFNSTINYYIRHLCNNGCLDPISQIVTDFTDYLKESISEEQVAYINSNVSKSKNNKDLILRDVLTLIKTMRSNGKYDEQTLKLIEDGIKSIL